MIKEILTAAGVNHRQGRYTSPPAGTYAVYFDNVDKDGADRVTPDTSAGLPYVKHHDATIELYEERPDPATETAVEAELDARGLDYHKEDRYWLQDVQRYQVVYEFNYITKN